MSAPDVRGTVYWCPVCGAEIGVLATKHGDFRPRCCNKPMELQEKRLRFYVCPVCKAEVAVIREGQGEFLPRCCNTEMLLEAA